jgi:hypothetical protein
MKFKWWQWWSDWQDIGTFLLPAMATCCKGAGLEPTRQGSVALHSNRLSMLLTRQKAHTRGHHEGVYLLF